MALVIHCSCCDAELDAPGGIYLSPPEPDAPESVAKLHLCSACDEKVTDEIYRLWSEAHPAEAVLASTQKAP